MISYGNIFELSLLLPTIVPYETFPFSVSLQLQQQQQQNKNASFSNINIEMILRHDLTQFYLSSYYDYNIFSRNLNETNGNIVKHLNCRLIYRTEPMWTNTLFTTKFT